MLRTAGVLEKLSAQVRERTKPAAVSDLFCQQPSWASPQFTIECKIQAADCLDCAFVQIVHNTYSFKVSPTTTNDI